jgi:scyllo-inositol 2-dehydrogenase (NADP+)
MRSVDNEVVRVGLLAYGAIGHEHNLAVQHSGGLTLSAVCDMNPDRIAAALELAPDAASFTDADAMLASGTLDLVVISTPPNSHYRWAKAALESDLHVVLEKPMALNVAECDELMALAADRDRLLVVYQNRRFDPDFVTLRSVITSGGIGDLFQLDTFVGGYSEPCTYWHSDALISGGAIFDWGSHYIDQILNLIDDPVDHVTGLNQKRKWSHATNADHAQVAITFASGRQATFINSDLAAIRKPKFYALGSEGAIVGNWDLLAEPAVADLPSILSLHRGGGASQVVPLQEVPAYGFHRSLADNLLHGVAMEVTATQSRDVVAIMEAAEESALNNGRPVTPHLVRSGLTAGTSSLNSVG